MMDTGEVEVVWRGDSWRTVAPAPVRAQPRPKKRYMARREIAARILAVLSGSPMPRRAIEVRSGLTQDQVRKVLTVLVRSAQVAAVGRPSDPDRQYRIGT